MTAAISNENLARENVYLHQRNAQLRGDILMITADAARLRQEVDRLHGRPPTRRPDPLGGGQ